MYPRRRCVTPGAVGLCVEVKHDRRCVMIDMRDGVVYAGYPIAAGKLEHATQSDKFLETGELHAAKYFVGAHGPAADVFHSNSSQLWHARSVYLCAQARWCSTAEHHVEAPVQR